MMKDARLDVLDQNIEKWAFIISLFSNFVATFKNAWRHARLCDSRIRRYRGKFH